MLKRLALLSSLVVAGCSQTINIEDRPGATFAQSMADHDACHKRVEEQPNLYVPPQSTLAGAAGAGAIAGVSDVYQKENAVNVCMEGMGYRKRQFTPQEMETVNAAPQGPARGAVIDTIMRSNDPA